MSGGNGNVKEIVLGDEFGDIALKVNGATVEVHADSSIVAHTTGDVDAWTNASVRAHAAANDTAAQGKAKPEKGDTMPAGHPNAGWIYAGVSKTTNQPLYVAPKDSGIFQWKAAMDFAAKEGARVPSKEELDQIYDARDQGALKGTFKVTGSYPAGWYWSSSQYDDFNAWAQRFSDGGQDDTAKHGVSALRCVR